MERVVLLGSSGFIGRHLESKLQESFAEIEIEGRSSSELDLTDGEQTNQLFDLFGMDTTVIVCAGIKRQRGDNLEIFQKNLNISVNLCRLLEKKPVKRLIFFSSAAVYGECIHSTRITEDSLIQPTSYYGLSKFASEYLFTKTISQQTDGSLIILRPPLVYGPGDLESSYGPMAFIHAALNDEPIVLWGDGLEQREFIFVDDVARIVCELLKSDFEGVLNIANGRSYTYLDALQVAFDFVGRKPLIIRRPRTQEKVDYVFNNERLLELIPKFRFTPLEVGIRQTLKLQTLFQEGTKGRAKKGEWVSL